MIHQCRINQVHSYWKWSFIVNCPSKNGKICHSHSYIYIYMLVYQRVVVTCDTKLLKPVNMCETGHLRHCATESRNSSFSPSSFPLCTWVVSDAHGAPIRQRSSLMLQLLGFWLLPGLRPSNPPNTKENMSKCSKIMSKNMMATDRNRGSKHNANTEVS